MQQIDVTEGLESSLVMLGHKLREGVTVERDFGRDVPRIEAYAGELNQVRTNLIDNAIGAMDGKGTLRVVSRADGASSRSATVARSRPVTGCGRCATSARLIS